MGQKKLLTEVMGDYFASTDRSIRTNPMQQYHSLPSVQQLPVTPVSSSWESVTDPKRLHKKYTFTSHDDYTNFIAELLYYEKETGHYAKLQCSYPDVTIEVNTREVEDITEIDLEYAKTADQILEDVLNYGAEEEIYEY